MFEGKDAEREGDEEEDAVVSENKGQEVMEKAEE